MAIREHGLFSQGVPRDHNAKAACYLYGSNEPGIDTGVIIEGEGVLFIGETALREMAEVAGWSFEESDLLEPRVKELEEEVTFLQRERDDAVERAQNLEEVLNVAREIASELEESP